MTQPSHLQYSTGNDSIKDRGSYWPGHITAECLIDDDSNEVFDFKDLKINGGNQSTEINHSNNSNNSNNNNELSIQASNKEILKSFKILAKLKPGAAFSAITSSMIPYDVLSKSIKSKTTSHEPSSYTNPADEFVYDEFGFKLVREEEANQDPDEEDIVWSKSNSKRTLSKHETFAEDSKHKLKWIAYLEFTLNADIGANFSWNQVVSLNKCEKMKLMIRGQGIPHSLRPFVWMRFSGALNKKLNSKFKYGDLIKKSENEQVHATKQIEKDLLRTLPTNACFCSASSVGIPRLRRVLKSLASLYPNIGYCQGMGTIAASLLLFVEEEDAFWLMCAIIEDILPASYYSHTLIGVQADMKVLRQMVAIYLPEIEHQFKTHEIELSLVCINWFLTIFSNVFEIKILLRIWDLFFYDGSTAMFQITLAMLKLNEKKFIEAENSSHIFTILSNIPNEITDVDALIETSIRVASSVNKNQVDTIRRKHQAYLMAQNGAIINPSNYQNLPLTKEKPQLRNIDNQKKTFLNTMFKSSKSFSHDINNNSNGNNNDQTSTNKHNSPDLNEIKMKNIVQTELLVSLREVIVKIVHHFQTYDPDKYASCDLNADYSIESHAKDFENYMDNSQVRKFKRAKATMDFEKTDDDELGFKKNEIITVLSTKDDHCWIGELNGEKGWFPTRFVTLIDERNGKIYSAAGDDSVNDRIRDLIRNEFCMILKSIFENGLKKWSVLGGTTHPWSFIEEASKKTVEKDFESVYSRLVLCKTFRLDEDGKVLTPDELLFKSVQLINLSHQTMRTELDTKFRSLVCIGLNEQVLHIWLETLCSTMDVVEKWYNQSSFIRSPGWVQIKCELRVLAQFSFLLNPDAELPEVRKEIAINECIKDMLIKHHLFSWDLN